MVLSVLLLLTVLSSTYGEALWGQLGGNAQHTAVSSQDLSNPLNDLILLWKHANNEVLSGCAVDQDGSFICLSVSGGSMVLDKLSANGNITWKKDLQIELCGVGCGLAPTIALDTTVNAGYLWLGVTLTGFNSTTGKVNWNLDNLVSSFTSVFAAINEVTHDVYIFGSGKLVAVSTQGTVKWNITVYEPKSNNGTMAGPPAIDKNGTSLFLHYAGGLCKLDTNSGSKIWDVSLPGQNSLAIATPILDKTNNHVIVLTPSPQTESTSTLYVLQQTTGEIMFNYTLQGDFVYTDVSSTTPYQNMVLFGSGTLIVNVNGFALYAFDLSMLEYREMIKTNNGTKIVSMAGTANDILLVAQNSESHTELCTLSSSLKYLHCTRFGHLLKLFYPLEIGSNASVLLQYVVNTTVLSTPEFACYGIA